MKNLIKIFIVLFTFSIPMEKRLLASDVYFIDYSKVMNESTAGKKAQDYLKNLLNSSNKKFNDTAKKLKDEENKILASRNIISQEQLDINIKEFQNKLKDYRNYKSEELKKLKKIKNDEIVKLLNLINPLIQEYMKSNSINFLMDKKNIYIADKNYDLTNKLIEIINKKIK